MEIIFVIIGILILFMLADYLIVVLIGAFIGGLVGEWLFDNPIPLSIVGALGLLFLVIERNSKD